MRELRGARLPVALAPILAPVFAVQLGIKRLRRRLGDQLLRSTPSDEVADHHHSGSNADTRLELYAAGGGSSNVAKCWLGRLIGSGEIVRNPSLKSDRDRPRHLTALQGEVAGADQMGHLAVADPDRQAPQAPCAPARGAPAAAWRPPTDKSMRFSAKHFAYSAKPSSASQSPTCCIAGPPRT